MTRPAAAHAEDMSTTRLRLAAVRRVVPRMNAVALCLCLVGGAISLDASASAYQAVAPHSDALDIQGILQRVGRTYAALAGYYDRGVCTVFSSRLPELNTTQRFATRFERSKYFSWTSDLADKSAYRITFDGVRVVRQWYGRSTELSKLSDAIAGATGISDSAAFWVPTLLMPEMIPSAGLIPEFTRAASTTRLPDEYIAGERCFVLRAQDGLAYVHVWISMRDFLIRRLVHRNAGRDEVTTTDYTPQTDISLTP